MVSALITIRRKKRERGREKRRKGRRKGGRKEDLPGGPVVKTQ